MVPGVMLEILQQVSSGFTFPADHAQFWEGYFERLEGVPHHLKCQALVAYYSWDYAGHFATGFKWLRFQMFKLNFGCTVNHLA